MVDTSGFKPEDRFTQKVRSILMQCIRSMLKMRCLRAIIALNLFSIA